MSTDKSEINSSSSVSIGAPSVAHPLIPLPVPRQGIEIGAATLEDVDWIDDLQKRHRDRVGFQMRGAIEGKIRAGEIIVAWATSPCSSSSSDETQDTGRLPVPREKRLGYCMASDRYMKREDVGVVYQMNVEPGHQRGFVGAALLRAQFDRSAYGCRLYCCWCAQDIEANRFWEAMGFVPLAYRAGSEKRARVHIFWQKRIREGDVATPWWFPSQTKGGSMADRIVLPIPPGVHWSDDLPLILPTHDAVVRRELPDAKQSGRRTKDKGQSPPKRAPLPGGLCFAPPKVTPTIETKPREKKPKAKNDPKLVSAARELKDRSLEEINSGRWVIEPAGKYDVARALPVTVSPCQLVSPSAPRLPAPESLAA